MKIRIISVLASIAFASVVGSHAMPTASVTQEDQATSSDTPQDRLNERERAFEKLLTGAELVGHFTLDGADPNDGEPLHEERYSIANVTRIAENRWRFDCRIRYGENDVTVPLVIGVMWAGDTPVIGVTRMAVPGLGTYSARVLMYENKYAGTWSGANYGGHLFGRIEPRSE